MHTVHHLLTHIFHVWKIWVKENCSKDLDFIGHIGGGDFIVLFQSQDWKERCDTVLERFAEIVKGSYSEEERNRGSMEA